MNGTAIAHLYTLDSGVIHGTLDDVAEEETFVQPQEGGNCMNWILGHIVANRQNALGLVQGEPLVDPRIVERYARGSDPVSGPEDGAADTKELLLALDATHERLLDYLRSASDEDLAAPLPGGPSRILGECVGDALASLAWHEGYHAGQLGILRRMVGRPGVLK